MYRVVIRGQRHRLGADEDEAQRKFNELMAQPQGKPLRADSVVALIDEFLEWTERNRFELRIGNAAGSAS